jgi:hypothetical protein
MKSLLVARHLSLIVAGALAVVPGCQRSRSSNGIADTTFVSVMAALKRVQDSTGVSTSRKAALRDSILQGRGLTPARLEAAARELAQNPTRAQTVWQAVQRRAAEPPNAALERATPPKVVTPPTPAARK